jgi:hypothetical protein
MSRPINLVRYLVVSILGGVAGCGGPAYEFAPVEGKVTLNGKPLAGVIVKFYPDSESTTQLPYATGTTDEAGEFRLSVSAKQPGALVGPNIAVVSWPVRDRANPPPVPDAPIPVRYRDVTASPFRFEVKPGPGQTIDLPMDDTIQ